MVRRSIFDAAAARVQMKNRDVFFSSLSSPLVVDTRNDNSITRKKTVEFIINRVSFTHF